MDFSPDGKAIASAGLDRRVIVWRLDRILPLDEYAFACNWARNYLNNSAIVKPEDRTVV